MEALANANSVLALVALIVAGVAGAYSAYTRTTIAMLEKSNAAFEQRISFVEGELARKDAQIATVTAERDAVIVERDAIGKVVTGEVHLVAIENRLEDHHEAAAQWWATITEELQGFRTAVEGLTP